MKKLMKALRKARQQSADTIVARDGAKEVSRKHEFVLSEASYNNSQENSAGEPLKIRYTKTRVVDVPQKVFEKNRIVTALSDHKLGDTFRTLRAQVTQRLAASESSTLAITSPKRQEGKTFTACNLAVSIAKQVANTVVLVDLVLRRPDISKRLGLNPRYGLRDYLLDDVDLSKCFINPGIERLVVLPAGKPLPESSEILSAPKMINLAEELRSRYPDRLVIYDCPPLLAGDDTLSFLQHVDACLLVFREGETRKDEIRRALELLEGYNVVGSVFNVSSEAKRGLIDY